MRVLFILTVLAAFWQFQNPDVISIINLQSGSHMIPSPTRNVNFYSFPEVTLLSVICGSFLSSASILCSLCRIMFCYHAFLRESHLCFITHYFPLPETSKMNQNIPQCYFFLVHLINETLFYTQSQTWKIWRKKIGFWSCPIP